MTDQRIELNMTIGDAIHRMAGGDHKALTVCMELLRHAKEVDPDSFIGGLSYLSLLNSLNIRGKRIYALWNDVCGRDVGRMIALLRAYQFGQLAGVDKKALDYAIANRGSGINLGEVVEAVKNRLSDFNPEAVAA